MAKERANVSRPQPNCVDIGSSHSPNPARVPKVTMEIKQPARMITVGVRQVFIASDKAVPPARQYQSARYGPYCHRSIRRLAWLSRSSGMAVVAHTHRHLEGRSK